MSDSSMPLTASPEPAETNAVVYVTLSPLPQDATTWLPAARPAAVDGRNAANP
jgi:hypothetical protein